MSRLRKGGDTACQQSRYSQHKQAWTHCTAGPGTSVTAFQPRHANKTGENAYPLGGIIHVFVRSVVAKTAAAPAPSAEPQAELRTSPPGPETTHSPLGKQGLGPRRLGYRDLQNDFKAWSPFL